MPSPIRAQARSAERGGGVGGALLVALLLVVFMYPVCRCYAGYESRKNNLFVRYI